MSKNTIKDSNRQISKHGSLSCLPWLIVVLLVSPGGWFGERYSGKTEVRASEKGGAGAESKRSESKEKLPPAPPRMAVPLVSSKVVYVPKVRGKGQTSDMIVSADPKAPQKIIVQLADVKTLHHAMARIYFSAQNTDELMRKMNAKQPELYDKLIQRIKDKTAKDTEAPGFRNLLRAELLYDCTKLLGPNVVQEVIISEFVVR